MCHYILNKSFLAKIQFFQPRLHSEKGMKLNMENGKNSYTEVYTILQDLDDEEYNKIPPVLIKTLEENMNKDYEYEIDDDLELKDHKMLPETKAILFNLFRDYLATSEQKQKIIKMQNEERTKNELKKQQKYETDIFKNKKVEQQTNAIQEEKSLIKYKENIFQKIINKIKNWFKK